MISQTQVQQPLQMPGGIQTGGINPQGLPQQQGVKKFRISNWMIVILILLFIGVLGLVWFWDSVF